MKIIFYLTLSLTLTLINLGGVYAKTLKDFTLPIYKTKDTFVLSQAVKKNKIVINFWASWCTACIQELAELEALKIKYPDASYIAINAGEKSNKIKRFLKKYKFSYLILLDKKKKTSKSLEVFSLPQTIVVDKNRAILYRGNRPPKKI